MRRLPLDVGLRREPLVQTSQNVSRCLRGLACTRPAQVSRFRRSPRAAPPDTPFVGQFVGAMRSLQANQVRLTSVEKVRKRPWATAGTQGTFNSHSRSCLWAIVCPQREQCHCPEQQSRMHICTSPKSTISQDSPRSHAPQHQLTTKPMPCTTSPGTRQLVNPWSKYGRNCSKDSFLETLSDFRSHHPCRFSSF